MLDNRTVFCINEEKCSPYNGPSTSCLNDTNWTRSCTVFENEIDILDKFNIENRCNDIIDECGICGGDGVVSEEDWKENINKGKYCNIDDCKSNNPSVLDECGICGGDGIVPENEWKNIINKGKYCNIDDCKSNNPSVLDECGICGGEGVIPKDKWNDSSNIGKYCNIDDCRSNNPSVLDECGVCGGDGSSCNKLNTTESDILNGTSININDQNYNNEIDVENRLISLGFNKNNTSGNTNLKNIVIYKNINKLNIKVLQYDGL